MPKQYQAEILMLNYGTGCFCLRKHFRKSCETANKLSETTEPNKFSHAVADSTFGLDVNIDLTAAENDTTEIDHQMNLE
jgi:hypothetical protein